MIYWLYKINGVPVIDCYNGTVIDSKRRIAQQHCVGLDDIKLIKVSHISADTIDKINT